MQENKRRTHADNEYEIEDTGALQEGYWDVSAEYAKEDDNDIAIRITVRNQGPREQTIDVLPTLWFRNTWIWGCHHEGCTTKPLIKRSEDAKCPAVVTKHETLDPMAMYFGSAEREDGAVAVGEPPLWFTENETNSERLFGAEQYTPYTKDAFHRHLINGETAAISPKERGTKCAARYHLTIAPGAASVIRLRLCR